MFKALTAIITLAASASVMAQGDVTLNSLAHDTATRASFNQMVKGHQLPAWVTTGGTGSLTGVMLGTLLIVIVQNSMILVGVPTFWQRFALGLLIIVGTGVSAVQLTRRRKRQRLVAE